MLRLFLCSKDNIKKQDLDLSSIFYNSRFMYVHLVKQSVDIFFISNRKVLFYICYMSCHLEVSVLHSCKQLFSLKQINGLVVTPAMLQPQFCFFGGCRDCSIFIIPFNTRILMVIVVES